MKHGCNCHKLDFADSDRKILRTCPFQNSITLLAVQHVLIQTSSKMEKRTFFVYGFYIGALDLEFAQQLVIL